MKNRNTVKELSLQVESDIKELLKEHNVSNKVKDPTRYIKGSVDKSIYRFYLKIESVLNEYKQGNLF